MKSTNKQSPRYVGIDVSKAHLHVACTRDRQVTELSYDKDGLKRLVALTQDTELVVVEATGGYEQNAVRALHQAGHKVSVINPRQGRDFARATGRLAKADGIDALVLADFAQGIQPRPTPPKSQHRQTIIDSLRTPSGLAMNRASPSGGDKPTQLIDRENDDHASAGRQRLMFHQHR